MPKPVMDLPGSLGEIDLAAALAKQQKAKNAGVQATREALSDALHSLPLPATDDDVKNAARDVLAQEPKRLAEFMDWYDKNGDTLLGALNG